MAVAGLVGLVVVVAAPGVVALLGGRIGEVGSGLVTAAWVVQVAGAAVAVLYRSHR
jgi:hypothetical protein